MSLDGLFSGEMMEKTLIEERTWRWGAKLGHTPKAVEIGAMVRVRRRAERSGTTRLRL